MHPPNFLSPLPPWSMAESQHMLSEEPFKYGGHATDLLETQREDATGSGSHSYFLSKAT